MISLDDYLAKVSHIDSTDGKVVNSFINNLLKNNRVIQSTNLSLEADQNLEFMIFIPFNQKVPPALIKTRFSESLINHRVIVALGTCRISCLH